MVDLPAGRSSDYRNMHYVYILRSTINDSFYIGRTNNLDRRFIEHNKGKSYYTKGYKPWTLIHVEFVNTRVESRKLEKYFKSGYGREIIKEIVDSLTY